MRPEPPTMPMRFLSLVLVLHTAPPAAANPVVYPPEFAISGPNRSQQLLVVLEENGLVTADVTAKARYQSSDEKVAKVDATGFVTATGTGEATITATWLARPVRVMVTVSADPGGWSFRNHVIPTLT